MGILTPFSLSLGKQWDATVERMHGMAIGAFEGTLEAYRRTIHPDDRATAEARVAEALQNGSDDYITEHRAFRTDGSVFWLRGQDSVIRANNEVTGLMGVPMETLVDSLKHALNEVVVDKTGLTGMYTFSLEWSDAQAGDGASQLPDLAAALERGLGLRLEKSSQDFDVLIIDHVERVPAGN